MAMKYALAVVMVILLVAQSDAQTCSSALANLNVCGAFVVPGSTSTPSSACCSALQAVDHDCLCSTLRIAAHIPAQCNLPAYTCGTDYFACLLKFDFLAFLGVLCF